MAELKQPVYLRRESDGAEAVASSPSRVVALKFVGYREIEKPTKTEKKAASGGPALGTSTTQS